MNRKDFLKSLFRLGLIGGFSSKLSAFALPPVPSSEVTTLTILHTNDVHSRIEPFPGGEGKLSNRGGFARRATLIQKIRAENPNLLLLDAGDIFQGTPYFNLYGGELELKLMSEMQYDLATIGNHEFDNGIEGIVKQLPNANFDFVCANYDFTNTDLEGRILPYKIFFKDGIKTGVFGLGVALEGLVDKEKYGETKYLDPIEVAKMMIEILKKRENCDVVICLSHLGYTYPDKERVSDIHIAKKTKGLDVIIGGHTHTFLSEPQIFKNKSGDDVLINQVGWGGIYLGRIDITIDRSQKIKTLSYQHYDINGEWDS